MNKLFIPFILGLIAYFAVASNFSVANAQKLPQSTYPKGSKIDYKAHITNATYDNNWGDTFHTTSQDLFNRVDGSYEWIASDHTNKPKMVWTVLISTYDSADDAKNNYEDLIYNLDLYNFPHIHVPSVGTESTQYLIKLNKTHTIHLFAFHQGNVEVEGGVYFDNTDKSLANKFTLRQIQAITLPDVTETPTPTTTPIP